MTSEFGSPLLVTGNGEFSRFWKSLRLFDQFLTVYTCVETIDFASIRSFLAGLYSLKGVNLLGFIKPSDICLRALVFTRVIPSAMMGMGSLSAATLLLLKEVDIFGDQLLRDVVIVCLCALVITLARQGRGGWGQLRCPQCAQPAAARVEGATAQRGEGPWEDVDLKGAQGGGGRGRGGSGGGGRCRHGKQGGMCRECDEERADDNPVQEQQQRDDAVEPGEGLGREERERQRQRGRERRRTPASSHAVGALARDWLEAEPDGRIKGGTQRRSSHPEQATNSALLAPSAPGGIRARRGSAPADAVRPRLARQHSDPLPTEAPASPTIRHAIPENSQAAPRGSAPAAAVRPRLERQHSDLLPTEAPASPTIRHAIPENSQAAPPSGPARSIGEPLSKEAPVPPAICDTSTRANAHQAGPVHRDSDTPRTGPPPRHMVVGAARQAEHMDIDKDSAAHSAPWLRAQPPVATKASCSEHQLSRAMSQACHEEAVMPSTCHHDAAPKKPSPAQLASSAHSQSAPTFNRDGRRPKPEMPSATKRASRSASSLYAHADTYEPHVEHLVAGCNLAQDRLPLTPYGLVQLRSTERSSRKDAQDSAPATPPPTPIARTRSGSTSKTKKHSSGTLFYSKLVERRLSSAAASSEATPPLMTSSGHSGLLQKTL